MPYSPLAQLCAWYSWMHRDQASLAINPLTRCLFTSREKEASTPVITFLRHITLSLLEISSIYNLHPHILMTVLHASNPQLQIPSFAALKVAASSSPTPASDGFGFATLHILFSRASLIFSPSFYTLASLESLSPSTGTYNSAGHLPHPHNYLFRKNP